MEYNKLQRVYSPNRRLLSGDKINSVIKREKVERSLLSRASLQNNSFKSFHYRGNRLNTHNPPTLISSTRQFLCLAPNESPNLPLKVGSRGEMNETQKRPFKDKIKLVPMSAPSTYLRSSNNEIKPLFSSPCPPVRKKFAPSPSPRPHVNYIHSLKKSPELRHRNRVSQKKVKIEPEPEKTKPLSPKIQKQDKIEAYKAQLHSYFGPYKRNDMNLLYRKMAPVLRVAPATTRVWIQGKRSSLHENEKKNTKTAEESELLSQKRVTFSDQKGLPLVRSMTPNYRRKHSYIVRWLETAGQPTQSLA